MDASIGERVRRVFAIQEARQAQYGKLKRAHTQYSSEQLSLEQHQLAVAEVTQQFSSLSEEVIALTAVLRGVGLGQAAAVLERLQAQEKEKLQLTVKWQVALQSGGGEGGGGESEEEEDFGAATHQRRELRKKLAVTEGAIAELLEDLRYECEPHLLGPSSSTAD